MQQSVEGLNGERAVFAAARAYLDFATTEAPFYDMLMQAINSVPQSPESSAPIWSFFVRIISETTNLGDDTAGAAALWSFLHGFTVLAKSGQLGESSIRLTFARGTQALVRGLCVPDAEAARSPS
jgi:hypothetical protein